MQRLEVSGAVRPIYRSLGFKGLSRTAMDDCTDLSHHMINASIVAETMWESGGTRVQLNENCPHCRCK